MGMVMVGRGKCPVKLWERGLRCGECGVVGAGKGGMVFSSCSMRVIGIVLIFFCRDGDEWWGGEFKSASMVWRHNAS